ncbi:MAG TPA: phosphate/phosphite/phosphonate ABC transporter substrate-binding protein [Gammaproteobacteria bacterium]|nr:phosphate/phosphite/phosphonate ABC transporter substrate-binding protein [Gammaproteobacteria bacterium]
MRLADILQVRKLQEQYIKYQQGDTLMERQQIKLLHIVSLFVLTCITTSAIAGKYTTRSNKNKPLTFAILPFLSPIALTKRFAPLRDYLSEKLGKEVVIETASSYEDFTKKTNNGEYDFVLTAPHFTLMALDTGKYELRAAYIKKLQANVVVKTDSLVNSVQDLAGKQIGVPPVKAIITIAGILYLEEQGLIDDRAAHYKAYRSHNAAMLATVSGEVDAAIASNFQVQNQINKGLAIRIVGETRTYPGMGLLTAKRLPSKIKDGFEESLVSMTESEQGKAVLKAIRYPGYKSAQSAEFEPARIFIK